MVSTVVDGLGDPDGEPDGPVEAPPEPVGNGLPDGAGVSSGGPPSTDGAAVGGVEGTCPRPPGVAQPVVARIPTRARIESDSRDRCGMTDIGMGSECGAKTGRSLDPLGRHRIAGT